MKKMSISMVSMMLVFSLVFSTSVFAAEEQSRWESLKEIFTQAETNEVKEDVGVEYGGHIQNRGDYPKDGEAWIQGPQTLGTQGESLRLEGFWIKLTDRKGPDNLNIEYRVHVENEGWLKPVQNGAFAGTKAKGQRVESVEIKLVDADGNPSKDYSVFYSGHVQNVGDMPANDPDVSTDWYMDGQQLGTVGQSLRLEAIQIKIIKKTADLTAYNALLTEIDELVKEDYQTDSWQALQAVKADNLVTAEHYQADVDAAVSAIEAARDGLLEVLQVESAQAITANQVQVVFNQPVNTKKVSFELKNKEDLIMLKAATWNRDKSVAILEKEGAELVEGNYSLTIRGLSDEPFVLTQSINLVMPAMATTVEYGEMNQPNIALGDTAYLDFIVKDQFGEVMDPQAYLELIAPTLRAIDCLNDPGKVSLVMKKTDPNYGKIKLEPRGTRYGYDAVFLTLREKDFMEEIYVWPERELGDVVAAPDTTLDLGETGKLQFTFEDRYGDPMAPAIDSDYLNYQINISKISGEDGALSLIKPAASGTAESDLNDIKVKADASKTGVYRVEVQLIKPSWSEIYSASTTVTVKSSAAENLTYRVVDVPALPEFSYPRASSSDPDVHAVDGRNPHAKIVSVQAVDGNGQVFPISAEEILELSTINDPNHYINVSESRVSPAKVSAQEGQFLVAAAREIDDNAPNNARLVVKVKTNDGARILESNVIRFDNQGLKAQELILTTSPVIRETPDVRPVGEINHIDFDNLKHAEKHWTDYTTKPVYMSRLDQYGIWSNVNWPDVIINSPQRIFKPGSGRFHFGVGDGLFYFFNGPPEHYVADTPIELGVVENGVVKEFTVTIGKTGIASVGNIDRGLTIAGYPFEVGEINPGNATASYQWQISKDGGETFVDLEGETNHRYVVNDSLVNGDVIRVITTGIGNFSGEFISDAVVIRFYA